MSDIRIEAVFSCLLLFVRKNYASVHEHYSPTLHGAGCKRSIRAVVSKVHFLPEALTDLSEFYVSFPRVLTVLPQFFLVSWKIFPFIQKTDLQVVVMKAVG